MKISDIIAKAANSFFGDEPAASEDMVREKAYLLWEEAGRPEGDGVHFWLMAEKEFGKISSELLEQPS